MAYVNNGTKVSLVSDLIPSGFVAPAVTTFADAKYKPSFTLEITKSTVETSDRATTLLAVIENATVGIEKQIQDNLSTDFDISANNVTVWIDFRSIDDNDKPSNSNDFYLDNPNKYIVKAIAYVKVAPTS